MVKPNGRGGGWFGKDHLAGLTATLWALIFTNCLETKGQPTARALQNPFYQEHIDEEHLRPGEKHSYNQES